MGAATKDSLATLDPATREPAFRELAYKGTSQAPGSRRTTVRMPGFRGLVIPEAIINVAPKEIRIKVASLGSRAIRSS